MLQLILLDVLSSKLANLFQVALLQLVDQTHLGVRRESLLLVELVGGVDLSDVVSGLRWLATT